MGEEETVQSHSMQTQPDNGGKKGGFPPTLTYILWISLRRFACLSWQTPLQLKHEHSSGEEVAKRGRLLLCTPKKPIPLLPTFAHTLRPAKPRGQRARHPFLHVPHPCGMLWGSDLHPCPKAGGTRAGASLATAPGRLCPRSGLRAGFVLPEPGWSPRHRPLKRAL